MDNKINFFIKLRFYYLKYKFKNKMIVGLTGSICSGKETLAKYLVECHGFEEVNILDLFKQKILEIQKNGGNKDLSLKIELRSHS